MKIVKFLFMLVALMAVLYMVCVFWCDSEFRIQIKDYLIFCGLLLHSLLLGSMALLFLIIKE